MRLGMAVGLIVAFMGCDGSSSSTTDDNVVPDTGGSSPEDGVAEDGASAEPDAAAPDVTAPDTNGPDTNPGSALVSALEAAEFEVGVGELRFFGFEDCIQLRSCYGNNPLSPYGTFRVPKSPEEKPHPSKACRDNRRPEKEDACAASEAAEAPVLEDTTGNDTCDTSPPAGEETDPFFADAADTLNSTWRLRPDEAIVMVHRTPPTSASFQGSYFGYTPYLFSRHKPATGRRAEPFGSIGDTAGKYTIAEAMGLPADQADAAFDAPAIVIVSASKTTTDKVKSALAALPASVIDPKSVYVSVPLWQKDTSDDLGACEPGGAPLSEGDMFEMGLDDDDDVFGLAFRVANLTDDEKQDYLCRMSGRGYDKDCAPGTVAEAHVFRLTPKASASPSTDTLYEEPELICRDLHAYADAEPKTEYGGALAARQAELVQHLRTLYASVTTDADELPAKSALPDSGFFCNRNGTRCLADNRDAAYFAALPFKMGGATDVFFAVGVNHTQTGFAEYTSIAIYTFSRLMGVLGYTLGNDRPEPLCPGRPDGTSAACPHFPGGTAGGCESLYVIAMARDCCAFATDWATRSAAPAPYCIEIPTCDVEKLQGGVAEGQGMFFTERAYVHPVMHVGPRGQDVLNMRIVHAHPRAQ